MKKLSKKQEMELAPLIEWTERSNTNWAERSERDIEMFFEWSEKGMHKELASKPEYLEEGQTGFHGLVWAKRWRERTRDPKNQLQ